MGAVHKKLDCCQRPSRVSGITFSTCTRPSGGSNAENLEDLTSWTGTGTMDPIDTDPLLHILEMSTGCQDAKHIDDVFLHGICRSDIDVDENDGRDRHLAMPGEMVRYVPFGFDDEHNIDVELNTRLPKRPSERFLHHLERQPTHGRLRRYHYGDDWLRDASVGMRITLIVPSVNKSPRCRKVNAMRYINPHLMTLAIMAIEYEDSLARNIPIDSIQVISSAISFVASLEKILNSLDEQERERVVMIQHVATNGEHKHVCFLEDNEHQRDRFIQELRVIWVELRCSGED